MLNKNPFYILDVSIRDNKAVINEAAEEKLADGIYEEAIILQAQKILMGSKTRLEAEIDWFLDISPKKAKKISSFLTLNLEESSSQILSAMKDMNGLTKCNLAAYICQNKVGNIELIKDIVDSQEEIEVLNICSSINASRKIAGFPEVEEQLVEEQLSKQKKLWVDLIINQIAEFDNPSYWMNNLLHEFSAREIASKRFLEGISEKYERIILPYLKNHEDQINNLINDSKKDAREDLEAFVNKIIDELKLWDEYVRPSQLIYSAKGLDEPRSQKVFETIRDYSLWLTNESNQHQLSLKLIKASKEIFAALPSASNTADKDICTLEEFINDAYVQDDVQELIATVVTILEKPKVFAKDVKKKGLEPHSIGGAKKLVSAFLKACKNTEGKAHSNYPWNIMLGLAIDINNDKDDPYIARFIVNYLKELNPPSDLVEKVNLNCIIIEQNCLEKELVKALESKDLSEAKTILSRLLLIAQTNETKEYYQSLLNKINEKNKENYTWIIGAGIILFVLSCGSYLNSTSKNNYNIKSYDQRSEVIPPLNNQHKKINKSQLRWCLYQKERIDLIDKQFPIDLEQTDNIKEHNTKLVTEEIFNKYSLLIDDYNSRCHQVKYLLNDEQSIKSEMASNEIHKEIREGAYKIMLQWNKNFWFKD